MAPIKAFAGKFAEAAFAVSSTRSPSSFSSSSTSPSLSSSSYSSYPPLLFRLRPLTALSSPLLKTAKAPSSSCSSGLREASDRETDDDFSSFRFERMCEAFGVTPVDTLRLSSDDDNDEGGGGCERGLRLRRAVPEGGVLLSVPASACFRDDEAPRWLTTSDVDDVNVNNYAATDWASRLAACILDAELNDSGNGIHLPDRADADNENDVDIDSDSSSLLLRTGREIWRSTLPDSTELRASLPVHWGEEVLGTSKCTALELAVDSAYFARGSAVPNLAEGLRGATVASHNGRRREQEEEDSGEDEDMVPQTPTTEDGEMLQQKADLDALNIAMDMDRLQRKCHDALDIVQTRACRVERRCEDGVQWGPPLRVLAPVFDLINHGTKEGRHAANARFGLEGGSAYSTRDARLVVRALRDMEVGEEVRVDYGDRARPAWRCLETYGFVPEHDGNGGNNNNDAGGEDVEEDVAELWMNGLRFEVDSSSVPFELAEVAAAQVAIDGDGHDGGDGGGGDDELGGDVLTPSVARAIAKRATQAAFNLVTEPEMVDSEEDWDSPALVAAASRAASLRWSQHKVLLAFAENLQLFSSEPSASSSERAE